MAEHKDGLPSTDFSRMNREWVKAVADAAAGDGGGGDHSDFLCVNYYFEYDDTNESYIFKSRSHQLNDINNAFINKTPIIARFYEEHEQGPVNPNQGIFNLEYFSYESAAAYNFVFTNYIIYPDAQGTELIRCAINDNNNSIEYAIVSSVIQ